MEELLTKNDTFHLKGNLNHICLHPVEHLSSNVTETENVMGGKYLRYDNSPIDELCDWEKKGQLFLND